MKPLSPTCNKQASSFKDRVRRHLLSTVSQEPREFLDILKCSHNCDPLIVKNALAELVEKGAVIRGAGPEGKELFARKGISFPSQGTTASASRANLEHSSDSLVHPWASYVASSVRAILRSMPEPSPAYSQWWFEPDCYRNLLSLIYGNVGKRASVAFLGAPTLGAAYSQLVRGTVSIFDADPAALAAVRPHCSPSTRLMQYDAHELLDDDAKNRFNFVYVDPPWGSSLLRLFIARATEFAVIKGKVAISFPPVFTRPNANRERCRLLHFASRLGLRCFREIPSLTKYSVPAFEMVAYAANGLRLNAPWRSGDVILFQKQQPSAFGRSAIGVKSPFQWEQFSIGTHRLFLRHDGREEKGPPSIAALPWASDFICRTTSSRDRAMQEASLLSSRNVVAHIKGRASLSEALPRILHQIKGNRGNTGKNNCIRIETMLTLRLAKVLKAPEHYLGDSEKELL